MSQNNSKQDKLLQLRSKIDQIDDALINLINQRIAIVKEVGIFKESVGDKFFVKSAREADMIKDLIEKVNPDIPKSMIVNIWRKMITCANVLEQNLQISLYNPDEITDYQYLIKEYYADFAPLKIFKNLGEIMTQIENEESHIAVFALPKNSNEKIENWWSEFSKNNYGLKIYALIPFIGQSNHQLVAAAIKKPEKSKEDYTLAVIKGKGGFEGENFEILQKNDDQYLVKFDDFLEIESQIPVKGNDLEIKIIGHFAKPIKI